MNHYIKITFISFIFILFSIRANSQSNNSGNKNETNNPIVNKGNKSEKAQQKHDSVKKRATVVNPTTKPNQQTVSKKVNISNTNNESSVQEKKFYNNRTEAMINSKPFQRINVVKKNGKVFYEIIDEK